MSALVDVYVQQFKTTIATQLQYRAALVIWLIGHILEPLMRVGPVRTGYAGMGHQRAKDVTTRLTGYVLGHGSLAFWQTCEKAVNSGAFSC